MKPFENDAEVLTLHGLTVENGKDVVLISGSLDLARDRESLEVAKKLRDCLDAVIGSIEGQAGLPQKVTGVKKVAERKVNPLRRR